MKPITRILTLSFIISTLLGVLLYFSFNINFYRNHTDDIEITPSRLSAVQNVYSFLQKRTPLNDSFTRLESAHLEDVQNIYRGIIPGFWIFLVLFCITVVYCLYSLKYNNIINGIIFGSTLLLVGMLGLWLAITIDFDFGFEIFHKILFPQGNRSFAADSNLIILFPISFFIAISQAMFLSIAAIAVFSLSLGIGLKFLSRTEKIEK